MSFERPQTLASPSGATLSYAHQPAEGRARGVVQILHGLADHSGRYDRFAAFLAAQGFHVYAHDHRGHGHTRAPDAPLTIFSTKGGGADKVIADVAAMRNLVRREQPNLPVVLFGHSLGGLIALGCLQAFPTHLDAVAAWNAPLPARFLQGLAALALDWERFRRGSDVASTLFPRFTFRAWARAIRDRRTDWDWLSRDAAEVDDYIADPLAGWEPSVSMWADVFELTARASERRRYGKVRIATPIGIVGGGGDPVTGQERDCRKLADRLGRLGFSNVDLTIYPDTRHEGLNDINRQEIMEDFVRWMEKALDAKKEGAVARPSSSP